MLASFLAEALITTVMGLLVAVPALWCHNYLRSRMHGIQSEMTNATLETLTYLETRSNFRDQVEHCAATAGSLSSGGTYGLPVVAGRPPMTVSERCWCR
jgi:MotA/TolQ/ExbB proton channel family